MQNSRKPDEPIERQPSRPDRAALRAFLILAVSFTVMFAANMAMSYALNVRAGHPIATRCDVWFQSDSGQRIQDARDGENSFGSGSHFLMAKLWPRGLHAIHQRWPDLDVVLLCRAVVAFCVAGGWSVLALALIGGGAPKLGLALVAILYCFGTAQTISSLPDHFAVSAGLLPLAFAIFLFGWNRQIRLSPCIGLLLMTAVLAGGVCITNVLLPLLLILTLLWRHWRLQMRWLGITALVAILIVIPASAFVRSLPNDYPLVWQMRMWLNMRLMDDPAGAGKRIFRGVIHPAIGPDADIDSNNFFRVPMLTYEPLRHDYPLWPYDWLRSVSASAWLILLALSLRQLSVPQSVLLIWITWNLVFHNIWGDEYFLYSPHYSWASFVIIALNVPRGLPILAALIVPGQLQTLMLLSRQLGTIET